MHELKTSFLKRSLWMGRYLYSGEAVLKTMTVLPLLLLADKYEVSCLRRSCLQFMMDHVVQSPDTNRALTWYQYAQVGCEEKKRVEVMSFKVMVKLVILMVTMMILIMNLLMIMADQYVGDNLLL